MARIILESGDRIVTETGNALVTEANVAAPDHVRDSSRARDTWLAVCIDIEFTDGHLRLWSGATDLLFENEEWTGLGSLLEATPNENTKTFLANKITIALNAVNASVRRRVTEPIGHLPAILRWIKSTDGGATWSALPVGRYGYTSNLRRQSEQILIDVVHPFELAFRRRPHYWSNEDQRRAHASDSGFAMMRQIASGHSIKFPFLKQSQK